MDITAQVKGPASCFPSIGNTCGTPVAPWFALPDSVDGLKHGGQVGFPKAQHGLGHGHANARLACRRAQAGGAR